MSSTDMFRCIPTDRLAAIVTRYISEHYGEENAVSNFCHDACINPRFLRTIILDERPNISFEVVDEMFANLGCQHIWHLAPEDGGLADYYLCDIPPARRQPNVEQARACHVENMKRKARNRGVSMMEEAHDRALADDALMSESVAA